jgi:hypothetical protein
MTWAALAKKAAPLPEQKKPINTVTIDRVPHAETEEVAEGTEAVAEAVASMSLEEEKSATPSDNTSSNNSVSSPNAASAAVEEGSSNSSSSSSAPFLAAGHAGSTDKIERAVVVDAGAAIRLQRIEKFGSEFFTTDAV